MSDAATRADPAAKAGAASPLRAAKQRPCASDPRKSRKPAAVPHLALAPEPQEPSGGFPAAGASVDDPFGLLSDLDADVLGASLAAMALAYPAGPDAFGLAAQTAGTAGPSTPSSEAPADGCETPAPHAKHLQCTGGRAGQSPAAGHRVHAVGETCPDCGGAMRRTASNLERVCTECGLIDEGDTAEPDEDEAPRAEPNAARLRIVGPNSSQLQPDLYRSGSGNTAASQTKQIFEEYKAYNRYYAEAYSKAFPLDACARAAEFYHDVQKTCVKRSQNKKAIMAACLRQACYEKGFAPKKAEVAAFMQLPTNGTARGDNFIRALVADGKMELDLDADHSRPEIETLFANLGLEGDRYRGLREAVYEIVQTAIEAKIGTNSILRSKVAGATYAVLRRCRDSSLVPRPLNLQQFCGVHIRKNTIERFARELDEYHCTFFADIYRRAGLDDTPARVRV